jgi:hypothetical protein
MEGMMAGRVIPFPSRSPHDEQPDAALACALCSVDYYLEAGYECVRCGVSMHGECYWSRIANPDEWKTTSSIRVLVDEYRGPCESVHSSACRGASTKRYGPKEKHWAYGAVGTVVGFWLKG